MINIQRFPQGPNEKFENLFVEIAEQLSCLVYCDITQDERGLLLALPSCEELLFKMDSLSTIAERIKESPTLCSFRLIQPLIRYRDNKPMDPTNWLHPEGEEFWDGTMRRLVHRELSIYYEWLTEYIQSIPAESREALAPLGEIRAQVCQLFDGKSDVLHAAIVYVSERFDSIWVDLGNYLDQKCQDEQFVCHLLNQWYQQFYELTWEGLAKDLYFKYKGKSKEYLAAIIDYEETRLQSNRWYQEYKASFDITTQKTDYSDFVHQLDPNEFIEKDLTTLFVSINTIAAFNALLNGDPLPGYEPLIPEEEEESTPEELTPDERRSATKSKKPKPGRPNDEFKDFLIIDYTSRTLPALEKKYKSMAEGQKGKALAIRMRIGVLANELTGMPSHAAIENLVGTIGGAGSRQAYDKYKDERFTNEETDKELAELKELGIDFPSFNG